MVRPMADSIFTQELEQNVRRACSELRERLRSGEDYRAESIFATYAEVADDPEAALEVVYTEYVTREELGQQPSADDVLARFPQWRERLRRLLDVHAGFAGPPPPAPAEADTLFSQPAHDTGEIVFFFEHKTAYEIQELIGRGGMGIVYQAQHRTLRRQVALKRLLVGEWASADEGKRFRAEAEAISRLDHPNIVKLFEVGEHDGQPYLVLELVRGGSLADLLPRGPLTVALTVDLVESLARALQHAHDRGILHRDLKPGNILLQTPDGEWPSQKDDPTPTNVVAKIADFGLAKRLNATHALSETGKLVGTPAYLAPERIDGKNDDPASDIYSVGVVLYECLTGRPPFLGDTPLATLAHVRDQEPVSPLELQPDCPRDLAIICLQCLQKDPRRRYPTAEALADDLKRFRQGEPIQARATSSLERLVKWGRRRPAVAGLLALVLVLTLGGGGLVTYLWRTTAEALEDTKNERNATADLLAEKLLVLAEYAFSQNKVDEARVHLDAIPDRYRGDAWRRFDRLVGAQRGQLKVDGNIHSLVFSPNGKYVGIHYANMKDNIVVWEPAANRVAFKLLIEHAQGILFSKDSQHLMVVGFRNELNQESRSVVIQHLELDGRVSSSRQFESTADHFPHVHAAGRKLIGIRNFKTGGCELLIWDLDSGESQKRQYNPRASHALASADGKRIGVFIQESPLTNKWKLEIIDWPSLNTRSVVRSDTVPQMGFSADFSTHYSMARPGDKDITVFSQYNSESGKVDWEYKLKGRVNSKAGSPDGRWMTFGGLDHQVHVVDAATGKDVLELRGHDNQITQFRFSDDSRLLASSDAGGNVRVWSIVD